MSLGKCKKLRVDLLLKNNQRGLAKFDINLKPVVRWLGYLPRPGFDQGVHPTILVVMFNVDDLLNAQLPDQQVFVDDLYFITHTRRHELGQACIYYLLLLRCIAVPVYDFMGKAFTAATNGITNTGGADANAGRFYGWAEHTQD
jgi:hypothetical protein